MFGDNLRVIRRRKNITQVALAKELGVTQQTIGKWETGVATPPLETITRVADFFDVSVSAFIEEPAVQPTRESKRLAFNEFKRKLDSFQALTVYLPEEQEEAAYRALNGVLEMLPLCFLEYMGDGKSSFDEKSFSLYIETVEKITLFSSWIESKAKEIHAIKSSKEAHNDFMSALGLSQKANMTDDDMKKEFEQAYSFPLVFEQLDMLFDELKKDWTGNTRRLFGEFLQETNDGKDN